MDTEEQKFAKYGCDEERDKAKETDSVISDRCWEQQYKNDSRKWLIRDASRQKYGPWTSSTMKDTYRYPFPLPDPNEMGVRRKLLLKQMYEDTEREIREGKYKAPTIEEYCTEYDGNYRAGGWVKQKEDNTEIYLKHPLYRSQAVTAWTDLLKTAPKGMVVASGMTKIIDIKNPFRKNYNFSKPSTENYNTIDVT